MRKVKGVFFVDYVKMMRHRKEVTWGSLLQPEDLPYLKEKIDPATWYPFDTFERLGLALLREVVDDDLEIVRAWGRASADALSARHDSLVCFGNPMESMMRWKEGGLRPAEAEGPATSPGGNLVR